MTLNTTTINSATNDWIRELGWRVTDITRDSMETTYPFLQSSVALQNGN